MSEINYQALREAAERAILAMERLLMLPADDDLLSEQELKDYGVDIDALNAFKFLTGPETVLALLDERERNQQYIKRRDQENEDIALTVGRLLIENGQLVADTLRHLADNEIDSDYFAITSTNENGTEIDHEMAITDYALQAAGTVDELVAALESAEKRIAELEAEPVSQTYNLPELIEGMEVSIDVSTCDADLGNRYFGTVTEASELDTAKNGYILLVQDAEPNFDINGNSPVTPTRLPGGFTIEDAKELHENLVRSHISQALSGEKMKKKDRDADLRWIHGVIVQAAWFVKASLEQTALSGTPPVTTDGWISCSERMPDTKTAVLVAVEFDRKGDWRMKWATYIPGHPDANDGWIIPGASWKPSHWMPLPEPPQEMK